MAGKFLVLFGIATIFLAVVILVGGLVLNPADVSFYQDFTSGIFCNDGEKLERMMGPTNADGSQTFSYDCENSVGETRDVSSNFIVALVGGFMFFLLDGIITIIVGANIASKQVAGEWNSFNVGLQSGGVMPQQVNWQAMGIPNNLAQTLESAFQQIGHTSAMQVMGGEGDLTEKLRQLQAARDQNLISQAEYDQLRQALLTSFNQ